MICHIEVKMVLMEPVGSRPQHRFERPACRTVGRVERPLPRPVLDYGDDFPALHDKAGNVDGIPSPMF